MYINIPCEDAGWSDGLLYGDLDSQAKLNMAVIICDHFILILLRKSWISFPSNYG